MSQWYEDLATTLDEVWRKLARGVADRRSPARHPTLATVARDGGAEARTMILRGADRATASLEIHTDLEAEKVAEIRAAPRVALHVWDPRADFQLRLRGRAEIDTGEAARAAWERVPEAARTNYGGTPPPGTPIVDPTAHRIAADPGRFAILRCRLDEIETLHLGEDRHRRARFRAADGWRGTWLVP